MAGGSGSVSHSSRAATLALYGLLLRTIGRQGAHRAWAALALEHTPRFCGVPDASQLPPHDVSQSEGARHLLRWAFRSHAALPPGGPLAEAAVERGFDALRLCTLLLEAEERRRRHGDRTGVAFSLGAVVRHRKAGYWGVIYGWDRRCRRPAAWLRAMRVADLPSGEQQPFYYVLPDVVGSQATTKYVAQDNLEPRPEQRIQRSVSAYFCSYSSALGRYIPTHALRYMYPDDYEAADMEGGPTAGRQLAASQSVEKDLLEV